MGSVFRGLKEKALGNTSLMVWGERFGIVYSFFWGVYGACILLCAFVVNCSANP